MKLLSYEELLKISETDMGINEVNVLEKQLDLCSKKQFMLGQRFEVAKLIMQKQWEIDDIIQKTYEEINEKSSVEITSKKLIEKKLEQKLLPYKRRIEELKITEKLIEGLLSMYNFATNDIRNIVEILKLNNG